MLNSNPGIVKGRFWREGEAFIWLSSIGVGMILLIIGTLLFVIVKNGFVAFWPHSLALVETNSGEYYLGEIKQTTLHPHTGEERIQLKVGNRELYSLDFKWIQSKTISRITYPKEAVAIERTEYGNFYGFIQGYQSPLTGAEPVQGPNVLERIEPSFTEEVQVLARLNEEIKSVAVEMESLRRKILKAQYEGENHAAIEAEQRVLREHFDLLLEAQGKQHTVLSQYQVLLRDAEGTTKTLPLSHVVRQYQPNQMGLFAKLSHYLAHLWELFFDEPRESNTEGGLFPAIIGTVMLVLTMSLFSFPMGVVAAVYMKEYASPGFLLQTIRIAVNNLAGIPSIVWGIFGLSFFIYTIGSGIDQIFYPEQLPTPTFGTGGILWASLTLALLTVPVVIVATEEALGGVPSDVRHGSLALGATKFQTLMKVTLPMASPRIITGFILAMSRAAGEVAPLMITGVVKLAPALPIDGTFPFIHLERKFMHLGFHIYDVGFQSPNVEAAKPMVFVTTLLLLSIVILLSSTSIILRNKIRKRYQAKAF